MSELEPTRTCSNPTATEVLRRMLDERGVEWREHEAPATDCIAFFDGNGWHDCWESVDGEANVTFSMTPEQAIAATLGSCNCSNNCTNGERTETCHIEAHFGEWYCTGCGVMVGTCDPDSELCVDGNYISMWSYCPNCGRRIEVDG